MTVCFLLPLFYSVFSVKMHAMGKSGLVFKYQLFIRVFSFSGLICLFTTLVSPFWSVIVGPRDLTYVGLWNMCRNKKCRSVTVTSKILVTIKALAVISTISGLMAVVFTFLTYSGLKRSKSPLITNVSTGILSLLTMLLYGLSVKPNSTLGSPIPPTPYSIYISWSFVLGCFACFLFLLNGLLFLLIELQKAIAILKEHNNGLNLKHMEPTVA